MGIVSCDIFLVHVGTLLRVCNQDRNRPDPTRPDPIRPAPDPIRVSTPSVLQYRMYVDELFCEIHLRFWDHLKKRVELSSRGLSLRTLASSKSWARMAGRTASTTRTAAGRSPTPGTRRTSPGRCATRRSHVLAVPSVMWLVPSAQWWWWWWW